MKHEKTLKTHSLTHIASLTCVVHCIIAPFIVIFSPLIGSIFHSHIVEILFLAVSLGCGFFVISKGYCLHKRKHIVFLYILGAIFWILHFLLNHYHVHPSKSIFLLLGSLFVIGSYYFNHKLLKCCPESHS
jgi:hypothetical protein